MRKNGAAPVFGGTALCIVFDKGLELMGVLWLALKVRVLLPTLSGIDAGRVE
jgi:hypothetical protein